MILRNDMNSTQNDEHFLDTVALSIFLFSSPEKTTNQIQIRINTGTMFNLSVYKCSVTMHVPSYCAFNFRKMVLHYIYIMLYYTYVL